MDFQYAFYRRIILLPLLLLVISPLFAQFPKSQPYIDYISTYKVVAMQHMKKYGIPASITLAQGLLESGAGTGYLVQNSNNHFGIKCHADWKGGRVYKDDDKKDECFRKYSKAEESYEDHSRFLYDRPRYKALFFLEQTDYMGWAKGLQQAGYATDKAYANKLIKIVEDYELYAYDFETILPKNEQGQTVDELRNGYIHTPYKTHGLIYVIAIDGDTYTAIAKEFNFKVDELYKFNEVPEKFPLKAGDLVYFEHKKSKADKPYYEHEVMVGESMHSISQLYGLKLMHLYSMNKKDFEYVPTEGDILKLR